MGGCASIPDANITPGHLAVSKEFDTQLQLDAKVERNKIKLLLLGGGESGKSTVFKQMKVIYGNQFTVLERKSQLPTIYTNILGSMQTLLKYAKRFELYDDILCKDARDRIKDMDPHEGINVESGDAVARLWGDMTIQIVWNRRSEFQINEAVKYFFDKINTLKANNYIPDIDDMLYCRYRTSGIVTERYLIDGAVFEMYDVGGQRNERRKWIHCFENVTGVIFVVGLSDFNLKVFEDNSVNRVVSSFFLVYLDTRYIFT